MENNNAASMPHESQCVVTTAASVPERNSDLPEQGAKLSGTDTPPATNEAKKTSNRNEVVPPDYQRVDVVMDGQQQTLLMPKALIESAATQPKALPESNVSHSLTQSGKPVASVKPMPPKIQPSDMTGSSGNGCNGVGLTSTAQPWSFQQMKPTSYVQTTAKLNNRTTIPVVHTFGLIQTVQPIQVVPVLGTMPDNIQTTSSSTVPTQTVENNAHRSLLPKPGAVPCDQCERRSKQKANTVKRAYKSLVRAKKSPKRLRNRVRKSRFAVNAFHAHNCFCTNNPAWRSTCVVSQGPHSNSNEMFSKENATTETKKNNTKLAEDNYVKDFQKGSASPPSSLVRKSECSLPSPPVDPVDEPVPCGIGLNTTVPSSNDTPSKIEQNPLKANTQSNKIFRPNILLHGSKRALPAGQRLERKVRSLFSAMSDLTGSTPTEPFADNVENATKSPARQEEYRQKEIVTSTPESNASSASVTEAEDKMTVMDAVMNVDKSSSDCKKPDPASDRAECKPKELVGNTTSLLQKISDVSKDKTIDDSLKADANDINRKDSAVDTVADTSKVNDAKPGLISAGLKNILKSLSLESVKRQDKVNGGLECADKKQNVEDPNTNFDLVDTKRVLGSEGSVICQAKVDNALTSIPEPEYVVSKSVSVVTENISSVETICEENSSNQVSSSHDLNLSGANKNANGISIECGPATLIANRYRTEFPSSRHHATEKVKQVCNKKMHQWIWKADRGAAPKGKHMRQVLLNQSKQLDEIFDSLLPSDQGDSDERKIEYHQESTEAIAEDCLKHEKKEDSSKPVEGASDDIALNKSLSIEALATTRVDDVLKENTNNMQIHDELMETVCKLPVNSVIDEMSFNNLDKSLTEIEAEVSSCIDKRQVEVSEKYILQKDKESCSLNPAKDQNVNILKDNYTTQSDSESTLLNDSSSSIAPEDIKILQHAFSSYVNIYDVDKILNGACSINVHDLPNDGNFRHRNPSGLDGLKLSNEAEDTAITNNRRKQDIRKWIENTKEADKPLEYELQERPIQASEMALQNENTKEDTDIILTPNYPLNIEQVPLSDSEFLAINSRRRGLDPEDRKRMNRIKMKQFRAKKKKFRQEKKSASSEEKTCLHKITSEKKISDVQKALQPIESEINLSNPAGPVDDGLCGNLEHINLELEHKDKKIHSYIPEERFEISSPDFLSPMENCTKNGKATNICIAKRNKLTDEEKRLRNVARAKAWRLKKKLELSSGEQVAKAKLGTESSTLAVGDKSTLSSQLDLSVSSILGDGSASNLNDGKSPILVVGDAANSTAGLTKMLTKEEEKKRHMQLYMREYRRKKRSGLGTGKRGRPKKTGISTEIALVSDRDAKCSRAGEGVENSIHGIGKIDPLALNSKKHKKVSAALRKKKMMENLKKARQARRCEAKKFINGKVPSSEKNVSAVDGQRRRLLTKSLKNVAARVKQDVKLTKENCSTGSDIFSFRSESSAENEINGTGLGILRQKKKAVQVRPSDEQSHSELEHGNYTNGTCSKTKAFGDCRSKARRKIANRDKRKSTKERKGKMEKKLATRKNTEPGLPAVVEVKEDSLNTPEMEEVLTSSKRKEKGKLNTDETSVPTSTPVTIRKTTTGARGRPKKNLVKKKAPAFNISSENLPSPIVDHHDRLKIKTEAPLLKPFDLSGRPKKNLVKTKAPASNTSSQNLQCPIIDDHDRLDKKAEALLLESFDLNSSDVNDASDCINSLTNQSKDAKRKRGRPPKRKQSIEEKPCDSNSDIPMDEGNTQESTEPFANTETDEECHTAQSRMQPPAIPSKRRGRSKPKRQKVTNGGDVVQMDELSNLQDNSSQDENSLWGVDEELTVDTSFEEEPLLNFDVTLNESDDHYLSLNVGSPPLSPKRKRGRPPLARKKQQVQDDFEKVEVSDQAPPVITSEDHLFKLQVLKDKLKSQHEELEKLRANQGGE